MVVCCVILQSLSGDPRLVLQTQSGAQAHTLWRCKLVLRECPRQVPLPIGARDKHKKERCKQVLRLRPQPVRCGSVPSDRAYFVEMQTGVRDMNTRDAEWRLRHAHIPV